MRLIVKHVVQTKAGTYTYRRRVPKGVCEVLGKTEIKKALGKSQSQALKHYQSFHREVERLLKSAQRAAASKTVAPRTEYEVHREALRRLQDIGFDEIKGFGLGDDEDEDLHREVVSDSIADQYPIDPNTGGPAIDNAVATQQLKILRSAGRVSVRYQFTDAVNHYIEEKVRGTHNEHRKITQRNHVASLVTDALGRDPFIDDISREDAREVRDYMLLDRGMSGSSAQRYLNDIRAIMNFALEEFELEHAKNPFSGLSIPASSSTKDDKRAFTKDELIDVKGRIQAHVNPELQLIWKMLEGTGCRMAEITGLLVSDVRLKDTIPHLVIQVHPHRRLKTKGSSRLVPLLGGALSAAEEAVKDRSEREFLFQR